MPHAEAKAKIKPWHLIRLCADVTYRAGVAATITGDPDHFLGC